MSLTAGIVGLPNVGKSTLFNAITKAGVEAANYPFATINPNVGVVEVPDHRLVEITKLVKPNKVVPTTFEFTDIAGLVKGASKGEGLGNKFLANIRETDAICQVVRCFRDSDITHVDGSVHPIRDIETINFELIFADIESMEKRAKRVEKKALSTKDKDAIFEYETCNKILKTLMADKPARLCELTKEETEFVKNFQLLTMKPILYVANLGEEDLMDPLSNNHYVDLLAFAKEQNAIVIPICAKVEEEIAQLDDEEKAMFLADFGLAESGLDHLIRESYELLGLQTYFTAGVQEVRAWTFKKGMTAPECAGIIHSDFQRGFIRAQTISYEDLVAYGSEAACRENGKLRLEGKSYIVKDGDIMEFLFNV